MTCLAFFSLISLTSLDLLIVESENGVFSDSTIANSFAFFAFCETLLCILLAIQFVAITFRPSQKTSFTSPALSVTIAPAPHFTVTLWPPVAASTIR